MKFSPPGARGIHGQHAFVKKALLFVGLFLVTIAIVTGIAIRLSLGGYLKSEECRKWLGTVAQRFLGGAQAEFLPLQAQGLDSIYSDGFTAKLADGGRYIDAEQLRADLKFSLFSRSCRVPLLDVARLRVTLPSVGGVAEMSGEAAGEEAPLDTGRFQIDTVQFGNFGLFIPGSLDVEGVRVQATSLGHGAWNVALDNGRVKLGNGTEWSLKKGEGRIEGHRLALTGSQLSAKGGGEARFTGDFGLQGGAGTAGNTWQASFKGVPVRDYVPKDWRARLEGQLGGELKGDTAGKLEGRVEVRDGILIAAPGLEKVAQVTHTEAFRRLPLHEATAHVAKRPEHGEDAWDISDLVIESKGIVRVEGALATRDGQVSGTLQVGLPPAILKWVPGGRESVFTEERIGYYWTPVQISGPATHPREDLSGRLASAAVKATVGSAVDSIKQGAQGIFDAVEPHVPVDKAKELKDQFLNLF